MKTNRGNCGCYKCVQCSKLDICGHSAQRQNFKKHIKPLPSLPTFSTMPYIRRTLNFNFIKRAHHIFSCATFYNQRKLMQHNRCISSLFLILLYVVISVEKCVYQMLNCTDQRQSAVISTQCADCKHVCRIHRAVLYSGRCVEWRGLKPWCADLFSVPNGIYPGVLPIILFLTSTSKLLKWNKTSHLQSSIGCSQGCQTQPKLYVTVYVIQVHSMTQQFCLCIDNNHMLMHILSYIGQLNVYKLEAT